MLRITTIIVLLVLVAQNFAHAAPPEANQWLQWRGPSRDGQIQAAQLPTSLGSDTFCLRWRVPLGESYASPIVTESTVYTVETIDKKYEVVRALDRETGDELWQTRWRGSLKVPFFADRNGSWVRATPAFADGTLYVAGMRDVLVALDGETGEMRWKIDFPAALGTPLPKFGFVSSPLVDGEHLYVQAGAAVVKINRADGSIVWKAADDGGGMTGSAFSSPILAKIHGRQELIVQRRADLIGMNPESGRLFWSQPIKSFRGMNILTPTVWNDSIFTSAYGGRTHLWQPPSAETATTVEPLWSNKLQGYMCSPVIIGDHAYLHLRNKRFASVDLRTGGINWTSDKRFGEYMSLVASGDRILALDQKGILYLFEVSPQGMKIIDQRKIADAETWAHIALAGNQVFIRELNAMAVYDLAGEAR